MKGLLIKWDQRKEVKAAAQRVIADQSSTEGAKYRAEEVIRHMAYIQNQFLIDLHQLQDLGLEHLAEEIYS